MATQFSIDIDNAVEGYERVRRNDETVFVTEATTWGATKKELEERLAQDCPEEFDTEAAQLELERFFKTLGVDLRRRVTRHKDNTPRIVWYFKDETEAAAA